MEIEQFRNNCKDLKKTKTLFNFRVVEEQIRF